LASESNYARLIPLSHLERIPMQLIFRGAFKCPMDNHLLRALQENASLTLKAPIVTSILFLPTVSPLDQFQKDVNKKIIIQQCHTATGKDCEQT